MKCFGRTGICQRFGRFMAQRHRTKKQSIHVFSRCQIRRFIFDNKEDVEIINNGFFHQ
jgi:hypothetical protein